MIAFFKGFEGGAIAFVNRVNGLLVELFVGLEDGRIFADGSMDLRNALVEDATDAEVLLKTEIGEEVAGVHLGVLGIEKVDAAEALDEANGVPVEVVVHQIGGILEV